MSLPGKHMEQLRLFPSQMLPRNQLKKPLRDILRDISKRSKANVDMRGGPGGAIIFEGSGSVNGVREALKDVAQQVGSKVRFLQSDNMKVTIFLNKMSFFFLAICPCPHPHLRSSSYHWPARRCGSRHPATHRRTGAGSPCRRFRSRGQ